MEFLSIFGSRLFVRLFGVLFLAIGLRHARRVGTKPLGSLRQGFCFIFCFFRLRDRYEDEDEDEDERGNEIVARCQNEYHGWSPFTTRILIVRKLRQTAALSPSSASSSDSQLLYSLPCLLTRAAVVRVSQMRIRKERGRIRMASSVSRKTKTEAPVVSPSNRSPRKQLEFAFRKASA